MHAAARPNARRYHLGRISIFGLVTEPELRKGLLAGAGDYGNEPGNGRWLSSFGADGNANPWGKAPTLAGDNRFDAFS